jgi:hypothetical protein
MKTLAKHQPNIKIGQKLNISGSLCLRVESWNIEKHFIETESKNGGLI